LYRIVADAYRIQQNFIGYCRAAYDFEPTAPNQISMRAGDRIGIINKGGEHRGWWKGRNGDQVRKNIAFRLFLAVAPC